MSIGYSKKFRLECNRQNGNGPQTLKETKEEATEYVRTCDETSKILEKVPGHLLNMPEERRTTCAETHALNEFRLQHKEKFEKQLKGNFNGMCFLVLKWQLNDGKKAAAVPGKDVQLCWF
jgi:hypothetical protein